MIHSLGQLTGRHMLFVWHVWTDGNYEEEWLSFGARSLFRHLSHLAKEIQGEIVL